MQGKSLTPHTRLSTFTNLFKYSTNVYRCVCRGKKKVASDVCSPSQIYLLFYHEDCVYFNKADKKWHY